MHKIGNLKHPRRIHKVHRDFDEVIYGFQVNDGQPFTFEFTWTFPATQIISQLSICDAQPVTNTNTGVVGHVVWSPPSFAWLGNIDSQGNADPTQQTIDLFSSLTWQPGPLASPCAIPSAFDEALRSFYKERVFGDGSLIFTVTGGGTSQYGDIRAAYTVDPSGPVGPGRLTAN